MLASAMNGTRILDVRDALPALCQTPRTLKSALRNCLEIWQTLIGEIDFVDIFALSILREAKPDAFAFLQRNIDYLRGARSYGEQRNNEIKKAFEEEMERVVPDLLTRSAVQKIVEFVFTKSQAPQGVYNCNHADYWLRFLAMPQ
jgi:hypothetical protein